MTTKKKYFGLDYGTTMSLLYSYDNGNLQKEIATLSAVTVDNGEVKKIGNEAWGDPKIEPSPKRGINHLDGIRNGVTFRAMIEALLGLMIKKTIEKESIDRDSHITLTVPNSYNDKPQNYFDMYHILANCLDSCFASNHHIEIHLLPEPVAAALFYVYKHFQEIPRVCRLLVCDIGGGTTDLCIIECRKDRERRELFFKVINGMQQDENLGGNNFDKEIERNKIPSWLSGTFESNVICQRLKCKLSNKEQAKEIITKETNGSTASMEVSITRTEFEAYISDHLEKLSELMKKLLSESGMKVDDTWYILPVGGSCKIPAIQHLLEDVFKGAHPTYLDENTIFESVAQGAAIYSAWCANALNNSSFNDYRINIEHHTPHDIKFQTAYGAWQTLVPKNSPDDNYPLDPNEANVHLVNHSNIVDGKQYTVGEIHIKVNEDAEPITQKHDKLFSLDGRNIEEIALQLGVEIKNSCIVRLWIKDCETGEEQTWTIDQ